MRADGDRGRRSARPSAWGRARSGLGALLAAVALAVQCFIIQPHVDAVANAKLTAGAAREAPVVAAQKPIDQPSACFICRELAIAGAAVLAAPPALSFIERFVVEARPLERLAVAPLFPAHAYLSRGPPTLL